MPGRLRRWGIPALTLVLLPVISVSVAAPADAATACSAAPYGVRSSAPSVLGAGRTVALTFDDGPGRDTGRMLAILAANHVTATFFNLGNNEAGNHATVRAEHAAGYALGDHTWDHKSLPSLGASGQGTEMDRERSEQASLTGAYPCLFRPPYGSYNATTLLLAQQRHMRVWNWSVDTEDWKAAGSGDGYWVNRITSRAEAGGSQLHPVILMHNQPGGNPATVAALPRIISYYRARGYTFVDLLGNTGVATVRAISPTSGRTAGGTRITITGSGFTGVRAVTFGSYRGTALRVVSSTKLYITTPRHAAGPAVIRVVTSHGTSAQRSADVYRYVWPPTVTAVSPASGPTSGRGARIAVSGTNFSHVLFVRFGSARGISVHVLSSTRLNVTAPAHAAGLVLVTVTTSYGTSQIHVSARYRYLAPAAVTDGAPRSVRAAGPPARTLQTGSSPGLARLSVVAFAHTQAQRSLTAQLRSR